ncbi:MAG: phage capsid protein, partial [Novosphingobium aromaticivorans]|nr:phage capsid protein [Novosphingobium aromaticivorans]
GSGVVPSPAEPAPAPANDNTLDIARFASLMGEQVALALKPGNAAITALGARLDVIETKLATEESPQTFRRSPATGGNHAIVTDC